MCTIRRNLSTLLPLLLGLTFSAGGQAPTSLANDDQVRCNTGDLASCTRAETARCNGGEARACVTLSIRYFGGVGVSRDQKLGDQLWGRAVHLADSACTVGELGGCALAGKGYGSGRGAPLDLARAKMLEERACAGGNPDGCFNIGFASLFGMIGIERDTVRAAKLLEATCAGGHSNACFQLGWNHEFGRTVPRDYKRAVVFYQQACDAAVDATDMIACHFLGSAYDQGRGVTEDAARAAQLYERVCQGGNGSGCNNFGRFYEEGRAVAKDPGRAAQLYDRACQLGNPAGCDNLSILYERGNGVPANPTRAKQLHQQACELGLRQGCRND
jgi:uncharacterized protein